MKDSKHEVTKPKTRTAKGLFRATGKHSKQVACLRLDGSITKQDGLTRETDDFYPTPPEPTRAIIKAEYERLKDFDLIWEPAAGDGAMCRELKRAGFQTYASDLVDRGCNAEIKSFYDYRIAPASAIVTNPPFKECNLDKGWIRHALETLKTEYMLLLLPLNWVGSAKERGKLWWDHTPSRIYAMRWRIDFTGQGAPPMQNAWFCWDKTQETNTTFHVIDRDDDICKSTLFDNSEAA